MTKELTTLAPVIRDLSEYLMMNLTEREYSFSATAQRDIVPVVKEILCHMRLDYDTELKSTAEFDKKKTGVLPNGNIIFVVPNVSCCAKVLFQPNFSRKQASGIHGTSFSSNMKSDVYIRQELYANVVLSSGTTMFQETVERMTNEPTALAPFTTKIKVVAPSK